MSTPQPENKTERKPLTAYGVFLVVLAALVLVFIPPLRLLGGILLITVFVGMGVAYAVIWTRIAIVRRKRRRIEASR